MTTIEIVLSLLQAAQALAPQVQADLQKGNVTPAQQQALQDALNALQTGGFSGPEWRIDPDPT